MRYFCNYRFSTVVTHQGRNIVVAGSEGGELELDDTLAAELVVQVPGAITPIPEETDETDETAATMAMKPGATKKARTRQVAARPEAPA